MSNNGKAERVKRAAAIVRLLHKEYGDAGCELNYESALDLLVAVILSAQCTDVRVNLVTPALFKKYRSAGAYANAEPEQFEGEIRSTGFFRQKTKSILGTAKMLTEDFDGRVPETMEELVRLPGVARKTANVILGTWFGKAEGIAVDTHVGRLAHRLDLTWRSAQTKDAAIIEKDLMELLARKEWTFFSHAIILHGRRVCKARNPECKSCGLARLCPSRSSR